MLKLQKRINDILKEYADDVDRMSAECVQKTARAGVSALKRNSPKRTGKYAGGWTYRLENKRLKSTATIYNGPRAGLAHLLEHGHVIKNGTGRVYGRTPASPHIEPIEQEICDAFGRDIIKVIQHDV